MAFKTHYIDVEPGDHFIIRYKGSDENAVAISTWELGKIMVSGPTNDKQKRFFFSLDRVEEIPSI